jgi:hypothetical protein
MKKLMLFALLGMLSVSAPPARAAAPMLTCLGLKFVAIPLIAGTAYVLCRCKPDYYLVVHDVEGEDRYWYVSQASAATLAKTGDRRCEGPSEKRDDLDLRAWANNNAPGGPLFPVFPCGPLGKLPSPNTNNLRLFIEQSLNGGTTFTNAASFTPQDLGDNWFIGFLPTSGTNGMTAAQLREFAECDLVLPNPAGMSPTAMFRTRHEATSDEL